MLAGYGQAFYNAFAVVATKAAKAAISEIAHRIGRARSAHKVRSDTAIGKADGRETSAPCSASRMNGPLGDKPAPGLPAHAGSPF